MIDSLIMKFIMWWCLRKSRQDRMNNPNHTIFSITGVGDEYPLMLMFTEFEHVRNKMMEI